MASGLRRSRWLVLLGVLGTSGLVAHCGSSDPAPASRSTGGALGDANRDAAESSADVPTVPDGSAGLMYHPACGVVSCVPDQKLSCASYGQGGAPGAGGDVAMGSAGMPTSADGGAESGGAGGEPSAAGGEQGNGGAFGAAGAGQGGEGGQSGATSDGSGGEPPVTAGGAPSSGGAAGQGVTSGSGGAPGSEPEYSCQVVVTNNGPRAQCERAGSALVDEPCFSTADCAPGLACVEDGAAAICRPFCCAGDSFCTQGSYCDERRLATDSGSVLDVPVCVPANDCSLAEPYPCEGGSCTCSADEACLVVRSDGTTTCAKPGNGELGDPCPCGWGYVCSSNDRCVALCETSRAEHYCGNSKCQASAELPEGWGVCVGPEADASR